MKKEIFRYVQFAKDIVSKRFDFEHEKKRHIGLRELSKLIGVSSSTLSRAMAGKKVDLETAILIIRWLNKDISDYITLTQLEKK